MQPPLTSLSWIDWAVWADFAADYRPKAEPFARKVVRSLRKMEAVGCDPRMILRVDVPLVVGGYYSPKQKWERGYMPFRTGWYFVPSPKVYPDTVVLSRWVYWATDRRLNFNWVLGSPADLPKPLQDSRLAWKFWKCVNRRALGIRDSVLEGLV